MKKIVPLLCSTFIISTFSITPIVAEEISDDYSYLENMSIKQLKELDVAIHEIIGGTVIYDDDESIKAENELSDVTLAALCWLCADKAAQRYYDLDEASIKKIYTSKDGSFEYKQFLVVFEDDHLLSAYLECYILDEANAGNIICFYDKLPEGEVINAVARDWQYEPEFEKYEELSLAQIAPEVKKLQKEDTYIINS